MTVKLHYKEQGQGRVETDHSHIYRDYAKSWKTSVLFPAVQTSFVFATTPRRFLGTPTLLYNEYRGLLLGTEAIGE
jgi:hypothetical protein